MAQGRKSYLLDNMKYFLLGLMIVLAGFGLTKTPAAQHVAYMQSDYGLIEDLELFGLARAGGDHNINACWFEDTTLWDETILIAYPVREEGSRTIGTWDEDVNTIFLRPNGGLNIATVSHEVSHMVDTFMEKRPNIDPHYRAYLQGYWTECVWRIVEKDIPELE